MIDFNSNSIIISSLEKEVLSKEEIMVFSEQKPAGFILFSRNIVSSSTDDSNIKTRDLIKSVQSLSNKFPFFMAIDQEGGRVSRIKSGIINLGACLYIEDGKYDDRSLDNIYLYGKKLAHDLYDLGFNFDFAPVVDIYSSDISEAVGDRCWGKDPESVSQRALSFLKGLEQNNVIGCLKHFPGLGRASFDTHVSKTYIDVDINDLYEWELYPYKKIIENYPPKAIMISHGIYPSVDDKPASLSKVFIEKILRKDLRYDGLVVSDDTLMKGFCDSDDIKDWQNSIVESVVAGVDLVLVCKKLDKYRYAVEGLNREAEKSLAFKKRLEQAQDRVIRLRKTLTK